MDFGPFHCLEGFFLVSSNIKKSTNKITLVLSRVLMKETRFVVQEAKETRLYFLTYPFYPRL